MSEVGGPGDRAQELTAQVAQKAPEVGAQAIARAPQLMGAAVQQVRRGSRTSRVQQWARCWLCWDCSSSSADVGGRWLRRPSRSAGGPGQVWLGGGRGR
jgi:hypothetical protein